jgi:nitrite reductase (NO-forming)
MSGSTRVNLSISPRTVRTLPVLETAPARRGPDRSTDRRITRAGLIGAVIFLVLATAALAVPADARLGLWLPVHLALAGAAGTAIAAMLPFFVAALAAGPPAAPVVRVASLVLVASGAMAGIAGRLAAGGGTSHLAAGGAVAYVAGMALVGLSAALSLRHASGTRRPVTERAYAIGLIDVLLGVSLVALYLAGDPGAAAAWSHLRVAHAWLNLLGFVTLVIAGSLVHFAPTVLGARIRTRRAGTVAVSCLAIGAPVVAAAYATGLAIAALAGALIASAGAVALAVHGLQARHDRAGWTTDLPWHRFTGGSLIAAPAWLAVATIVAAAGIATYGTEPGSWRLDRLAAPLVLGFVVQVLLASVSHLIPAVGPGTPAFHARQRSLLGRAGAWRVAGWNAGVALLTIGVLGGFGPLAIAAVGCVLASGLASLALVLVSLRG